MDSLFDYVTNASARRVTWTCLFAIAIVGILGDVLGDKVPFRALVSIAAVIFGYALLDHLHGIREHLAAIRRAQTETIR